jgi:hypothetical protein
VGEGGWFLSMAQKLRLVALCAARHGIAPKLHS